MIILWSYMIPWGLCSKYLFLCLYYDTTIFSTTIPPRMQGLRWHYNSTIILLRLLESCAAAIFLPGLRPHYDSTTILLRFWESTRDYLFLLVPWAYYCDLTTILGWYYYFTTVVLRLYYYCTIVCHSPPTMGGCLNPLCLEVVQVYVHREELASITTSGWRMIFLTTHWANFELPHAVRSRPCVLSLSFVNRCSVEHTQLSTVYFDGRYGIYSLDLDYEWSAERHHATCWKRAVSALRVICQAHMTDSEENSREIENGCRLRMVYITISYYHKT